MAYCVWGSDTGTNLAPARASSSMATRTAASTSGSMPAWKYSLGTPTRMTGKPSLASLRDSDRPAPGSTWLSMGS